MTGMRSWTSAAKRFGSVMSIVQESRKDRLRVCAARDHRKDGDPAVGHKEGVTESPAELSDRFLGRTIRPLHGGSVQATAGCNCCRVV
jgi:hypothetical protein